jgi:hypothetical protein
MNHERIYIIAMTSRSEPVKDIDFHVKIYAKLHIYEHAPLIPRDRSHINSGKKHDGNRYRIHM